LGPASSATVDRDVARLRGDALEPRADPQVRLEVETALFGDVCVGVEREVCERHRVADEPLPALEVPLHRVERAGTAVVPARKPLAGLVGPAGVGEPEPRHRDVRLVVVLLEEHPLQHLSALVRVVGHEACALAEVPEDRARLAERAPVVEHERRDAQ